jgi:LacI family transcriptional regulator
MAYPARSQQTDIVALYLGYPPGPMEPFPNLIMDGALSRLSFYHKNLLVYGQPFSPALEALCEGLLNSPIDGLILIPSHKDVNDRLAQSGLPLVAIADRAPGIVSVGVDNETGAYMMAEHLSLRGHRRVLYRQDRFEHESGVIRFNAFQKAAAYLGMELIPTMPVDAQGSLSAEEESHLLAPARQRPSAVVAWNDSTAYPVLKFCRLHQLNVPKDIALAGFDGFPPHAGLASRLTSIQAPWMRVAEVAVDILMCLIRGEEVRQETILPVDLVIGDTT